MWDEPAGGRPARERSGAAPLLIGLALLHVVTLVLLGALLARAGALEERAATTESLVESIDAASADDVAEALDELEARLLEELSTIRFRGVVPTDSSGLILERLEALEAGLGRIDDLAAALERLEERLDQICEGVPVC